MDTLALERSIGKIEGAIESIKEFVTSHPIEDRQMFAELREQNTAQSKQLSDVEVQIENVIENVVDNHGERLSSIEERLSGIETKMLGTADIKDRLTSIETKLNTNATNHAIEKATIQAHKRWLRFIAIMAGAVVAKIYAPEFMTLISGAIK